jgi:iron complex outermembrane receptor protein
MIYQTDAFGRVEIDAAPGSMTVTVVKEGFTPASTPVTLTPGGEQDVFVELHRQPTVEAEVTVVGATRTGRRLEDQPMRVEVLNREEIEEKMLMTPGDIVMMLNEMGGLRVQATSPSLGAASVRIQGMRGRYTRVLSDGLPLYGDIGGLGLLQIPPMDLGQVEVIKGVASALYGAGAMGGVVNLLTRRPAAEPERDVLLNRSTRGATDLVSFLSGPLSDRWSASLLAGGHWHDATDVNGDAWADLPAYARGVVRPRLFWDAGDGRLFFATVGVTYEDRDGGTLDGMTLAATGQPYSEALNTRRADVGAVGQFLVRKQWVVTSRVAAVRQSHDHQFGEVLERDRHDTLFGEVAIRGTAGRHTWVTGAAFQRDAYRPRDVLRFAYTHTGAGVFGQSDLDVSPALSISSSGRLDVHSQYGTVFSGTYTYVQARETVEGRRDDLPLTPRHSAGVVAMWEAEDVGRVGLEWYYTGRQRLEENPYRDVSEPYVIVGVLAERQLGRIRLFINGENLTGVRQTRWDPLLRPSRAIDGRWTVDAWAPLEGRNVNGGLRVRF